MNLDISRSHNIITLGEYLDRHKGNFPKPTCFNVILKRLFDESDSLIAQKEEKIRMNKLRDIPDEPEHPLDASLIMGPPSPRGKVRSTSSKLRTPKISQNQNQTKPSPAPARSQAPSPVQTPQLTQAPAAIITQPSPQAQPPILVKASPQVQAPAPVQIPAPIQAAPPTKPVSNAQKPSTGGAQTASLGTEDISFMGIPAPTALPQSKSLGGEVPKNSPGKQAVISQAVPANSLQQKLKEFKKTQVHPL